MKSSIIIPFRNREDHLVKLLPRLAQKFDGLDYEIIVAEQDDNEPFCKTVLMDVAVKYATGDILIFHDVDYYPMDNVSYAYDEDVVIYPVRNVVFLDEEDKEISGESIPVGYQHFRHDVRDHSGGVVIISKANFYKVNGFNPSYKGWGKEDDDFFLRVDYHQLQRRRNEYGTFLSLYHKDSAPLPTDLNFVHNNEVIKDILNTFWVGYANAAANVLEFEVDNFRGKWLKMTNLRTDKKLVSICCSTRHRISSAKRLVYSVLQTAKNISDMEILFKIDDDDTESINYINKLSKGIGVDIIPIISPRHSGGYYGLSDCHTQLAVAARGEFTFSCPDDSVVVTPNWDELLRPYTGAYGLVLGVDDNAGEIKTVWFHSAKLFRTMQWYGTHPYMDRWMNILWAGLPEIIVGRVPFFVEHRHSENVPDPTEPPRPPIHARLEPEQEVEWRDIYMRVRMHLEYIGKRQCA